MTFRVIPVPIPNTEVKPKCAENTCGLPYWEDRLLLVFLFYKDRLEININLIERNSDKLQIVYDLGINDCEKQINKLKRYLK